MNKSENMMLPADLGEEEEEKQEEGEEGAEGRGGASRGRVGSELGAQTELC